MSIAAGITAAKASLELSTKLMDLLNHPNVDVVEVRGKVHEMLIHLVNAQVALGEAQVEISELRAKLQERADLKAIEADMEVQADGGFYVKKSEKAQSIFNPYCPVCFGLTKQAVPLVPMASGYYSCAMHREASYRTKAYRETEERRIQQARADDSYFRVSGGPLSGLR